MSGKGGWCGRIHIGLLLATRRTTRSGGLSRDVARTASVSTVWSQLCGWKRAKSIPIKQICIFILKWNTIIRPGGDRSLSYEYPTIIVSKNKLNLIDWSPHIVALFSAHEGKNKQTQPQQSNATFAMMDECGWKIWILCCIIYERKHKTAI